jgi:hypothetical protein
MLDAETLLEVDTSRSLHAERAILIGEALFERQGIDREIGIHDVILLDV